MQSSPLHKRVSRHRRIRSRTHGTSTRPRLSVFRSGKHVFVQLIDDDRGVTLCAFSDAGEKEGTKEEGKNRRVHAAFAVGKRIALAAKEKGITRVVFDRGGYAYHGRVRAIADGARAGGLQF